MKLEDVILGWRQALDDKLNDRGFHLPEQKATFVVLTSDFIALLEEYKQMKAQIAALENQFSDIQNSAWEKSEQ